MTGVVKKPPKANQTGVNGYLFLSLTAWPPWLHSTLPTDPADMS
jgi:hypothetical protein